MYNYHGERSGGYSAIAFAIIVVIAGFLPGQYPDPNASAPFIANWAADHRQMLLVSDWLNFPAIAFYLWFLVGLRAYLLASEGQDEGLPTYAFAAGVASATLAIGVAALLAAIAYVPSADIGAGALKALYEAFNVLSALLYMPLVVFVFACAHSIRRHGSAPSWLAWLGYLAAVLGALATFSLFQTQGVFAPNGLVTAAIGFLPFAIWIVCCGFVMIRNAPSHVSTRTPA
jgi:hypothetical protein